MPKSKNLQPKHYSQLTPPVQCDLQFSAVTHKNIMPAAAARRKLDAPIPLRSADNELRNTIELRTTAPQIATICSSKTGSRRQNGKTTNFEALFKRNCKRKIINAKMEKSAAKALFATHAAITMRFTTFSCKTQSDYACSCRKEEA